MRYLRWLAILLIVLSVFSLTACGVFRKDKDVSLVIDTGVLEEDGLRETVLYYRDQKGIIVPVMKKIPWEDGIAKAAVSLLVDDPGVRDDLATVGLLPVLPTGTEVIGMSINEGLAKVDFNNNILSYDTEIDEKTIVQSLVYTLTEFEAIDKVQLLVDGKEMSKLSFGTKVKTPLERENINLSLELQEEEVPVVVYYKTTTNGEDSFYIPVTKGVSAIKADIKSVLTALIEGAPESTGLYSELPAGVMLNDVYVKDGVAYIDLSKEIENMPNNKAHQQSMIYELGLTLREIEPSISQIRILSGGKEIKLNSDVSLNLPTYSNKH
ncbi:GerMN domain-containing protein [Alkaliphilus sp. B6464]|uniref:GerMN domain-containing protein n=1 Tax=Alkaliphilus sp. B6464 TaxID=2731219 RepID=UPI001BA8AE46|nr:GerMN domain-containing protein [Alkaliphilus sp. B6464]QUH19956.1 GerMN domain-containing protein [Alkaliphilus sp. B6464]